MLTYGSAGNLKHYSVEFVTWVPNQKRSRAREIIRCHPERRGLIWDFQRSINLKSQNLNPKLNGNLETFHGRIFVLSHSPPSSPSRTTFLHSAECTELCLKNLNNEMLFVVLISRLLWWRNSRWSRSADAVTSKGKSLRDFLMNIGNKLELPTVHQRAAVKSQRSTDLMWATSLYEEGKRL